MTYDEDSSCPKQPTYLTIEGAASFCGISRSKMYQIVNSGKGPSYFFIKRKSTLEVKPCFALHEVERWKREWFDFQPISKRKNNISGLLFLRNHNAPGGKIDIFDYDLLVLLSP